jgi:hypothetical protein
MLPAATSIRRNVNSQGSRMRRIDGLAIFALLLTPALFAQEHYGEGPVWRVSTVRVKPLTWTNICSTLQQSSKPFLEEEKRQGVIVDYKFFIKETKHDPQDWDVCLAIEYKNHAALDGMDAKFESLRDKVLGGKQPAQQLAEKREEIRETVSSDLLQEIFLK